MAVWNVIDHQELTSGATSITKSSIPATYDHLYLLISARTDESTIIDECSFNVNGSTSAEYSLTNMYAYTSTETAERRHGETKFERFKVCGASVLADTFSMIELWIPNYKNTDHYKQMTCKISLPNNNSSDYQWYYALMGLLWSNTAAINELTLTNAGGDDFVQYSTWTLYGINGVA